MAGNLKMQSYATRLNTFHVAHQLPKRRVSSQAGRKKGTNVAEWPHQRPLPEDLADAGFYFHPDPDALDNVQCFFCNVKLDGWEETDIPLNEHLAHRGDCDWARCKHDGATASEDISPMDHNLTASRIATFEIGESWPHENKRGWKCKVSKMVEAGWCYDPAAGIDGEEPSDSVTCFYCGLSLDGWEQKDDPAVEHKKRNPECVFFALLDKFGSTTVKKSRAKGKDTRASSVSKASRQSALSMVSDLSNFADIAFGIDGPANADDSIATATANPLQTDTSALSQGKKGSKSKGATKATKGRQRADTVDSQAVSGPLYPDLSQSTTSVPSEPCHGDAGDPPSKKPRKGIRRSKLADTSILESRSSEVAPPAMNKARGRKPKAVSESNQSVSTIIMPMVDQSDVSAQLQDELDLSVSLDSGAKFERDERTQQALQERAAPARGIKRTSDGVPKKREQQAHLQDPTVVDDSSIMIVESTVMPVTKTASKAKKGKKASKEQQLTTSGSAQAGITGTGHSHEGIQPDPSYDARMETAGSAAVRKSAPVNKSRNSRTATSTRSSGSSRQASVTSVPTANESIDQQRDMDQDEQEIEAELARIAAEEAPYPSCRAIETETNKTEEFEPSPSSRKTKAKMSMERRVDVIQKLERELEAEAKSLPDPAKNLTVYVETVAQPSPAIAQHQGGMEKTPSPSGSDKENAPSSIVRIAPNTSPSKTGSISLAPGTPNRVSKSPGKNMLLRTTTVPWKATDLESILLGSPHLRMESTTPGTLSARLADAAGAFTSPEKSFTVEQWIRSQAEKGEKQLRQRCEELVARFESEGNRAMESLSGLVVKS